MRGTVLITGASAGIGLALAHQFAANDFDLILTARNKERLETARDGLPEPHRASTISADLAQPEGLEALLGCLPENVDILVNNAASIHHGNFLSQSDADISPMLHLNTTAPTRLCRHLLPDMIQRGSGGILNVASLAALQAVPGMGLYAASKAYVLSLSEALIEETRGTGVTVTVLCPGITRTDSAAPLAGDLPAAMVSRPEEVASAGFAALIAGEAVCVPGLLNQGAALAAGLPGRTLSRQAAGMLSRLQSLVSS